MRSEDEKSLFFNMPIVDKMGLLPTLENLLCSSQQIVLEGGVVALDSLERSKWSNGFGDIFFLNWNSDIPELLEAKYCQLPAV